MRKAAVIKLVTAVSVGMMAFTCSQNYSDQQADGALRERGLQAIDRSGAEGDGSSPQAAAIPPNPAYQTAEAANGERQALGAITVVPPSEWRSVPPSGSMRKAEYEVPGAGGGGVANLAVFAGNMGAVDDNVARWVGQFSDRKSDAVRRDLVIGDASEIKVTMVDVAGTFGGGMGGGGSQAHQRMLGAIVDVGGSFYYMKLLGPENTVTYWEKDFESFVQSIRK